MLPTKRDTFAFSRPLLLLLLMSLSLLCCYHPAESLVVPQELPSVLSLIYSNIPPIKKGTDSRVGFGFRLGEHADFQVMFELGPQKETRPIGDQDSSESTFNKRQVSRQEYRKLLLRQQLLQKQQRAREPLSSTERTASSWLQNWSDDMNASKKKTKVTKKHAAAEPTTTAAAAMPSMPVVPEPTLKQLQMLYKMATTVSPTTATAPVEVLPTKPVPYFGDALRLGPPAAFTAAPQDLQAQLEWKERGKSKAELTKELMDVSLDDDQ